MTFLPGLDPTVVAAARALGLLDAAGQLDPAWFRDPLGHLRRTLVEPAQRKALLEVLETLLPALDSGDAAGDEVWHPLLAPGDAPGNLFITTRERPGSVELGFAARARSSGETDAAQPSIELHVPLIAAEEAEIRPLLGNRESPLRVSVKLDLNLDGADDVIAIGAIRIDSTVTSSGVDEFDLGFAVALEDVDFGDGDGPSERLLDPRTLGEDAFHVLLGLLHQRLTRAAGGSDDAARIAGHALALLGFDDAIPPFPWSHLASDAGAARRWLAALVDDAAGPAPLKTWLEHLAGLFGGDAAAPSTPPRGTEDEPYRARLIALGEGPSALDLVAFTSPGAAGARKLALGLDFTFLPPGEDPALRASGTVVLAAIPVDRVARTELLPRISLIVRAPGDASGSLVDGDTFSVRSLRVGFTSDAAGLRPLVELIDMSHGGTHYPVLDLTAADAVVAAAGGAVRDAVVAALGESAKARALAALAGLLPPGDDPSSPHTVDLATLAAHPARAIADVHMGLLDDPAHSWGAMLAELATILGLEGAVKGSGSESDPWRSEIEAGSPIALELVAWDARSDGAPAKTHALRIGLRAVVAASPWRVYWLAGLLGYDRAAGSGGSLALLSDQHLVARLDPIPEVASLAGVTIRAEAVDARLEWRRGASASAHVRVESLSVGDGPDAIDIAELTFPAPEDSSPASALGISEAQVEHVLQQLLARAIVDWSGLPGQIITLLVGAHAALPGVPADWPTFATASPQSSLDDPLGALRAWLERVATGVSEEGRAFAPIALNWLGALLGQSLRPVEIDPEDADLEASSPESDEPPTWISGSGHFADPWSLAVAPGTQAPLEFLAWLEPAPLVERDALLGAIDSATGFGTLLEALERIAGHDPQLDEVLRGATPAMVDALNQLAALLSRGDGVVPLDSAVPEDEAWSGGETVTAPHHLIPADPSAVSQTLAQLDAVAPGERVALLVGPRFCDRAIWTDLLAQAEVARPGSTSAGAVFALRGEAPLVSKLSALEATADYYVVELSDRGDDVTSLVAQLGQVIARVAELRPGAPIVLVGHSTAGLTARSAAAADPSRLAGVITLGTPHLALDLGTITRVEVANALRWLDALVQGRLGDAGMGAALTHLRTAMDGFIAEPEATSAPIQYPIAHFVPGPELGVGGVQAMAIGSQLETSLLDWLKAALRQRVTDLFASLSAPSSPSHLAFGIRVELPAAAPVDGGVQVDASARFNAGRLPLSGPAEAAAEPRPVISIRSRLSRASGWLVGEATAFAGATAHPSEVRAHAAELGLDFFETPEGIELAPRVGLEQAANGGLTRHRVTLGDATIESDLGAVVRDLEAELSGAGSALQTWLDALRALGLVVDDARGKAGISADAFAAFAADPGPFLGPRLQAALASQGGLFGFVGPAAGPWRLDCGDGNIALTLAADPWSVTLETAPPQGDDGRAGLRLAPSASLPLRVTMTLPGADHAELAIAAEASVHLDRSQLTWSSSTGKLTFTAPPFVDDLVLVPVPPAAELAETVRALVPRLLLSCAVSALLRATIDPSVTVGPIESWLASPGDALSRTESLGEGGRLSAAKLNGLMLLIGEAAGLTTNGKLRLPGGIELGASGEPATIDVATAEPLGGVLSLELSVAIDHLRSATARGRVGLSLPLPGSWPGVTVELSSTGDELALAITPQGADPIQLLPRFSGLGALAGDAVALLPNVLDSLLDALGPPVSRSAVTRLALDVAAALELYDAQGGFAAHAAQLRELATPGSLHRIAATARAELAGAVAALFNDPASPLRDLLPGAWSAIGPELRWSLALDGAAGSGELSLLAGWNEQGPLIGARATSFEIGGGAVSLDLSADLAGSAASCEVALELELAAIAGIPVEPRLEVRGNGEGFAVRLLPLGTATESALAVDLAPSVALSLGPRGAASLARAYAVPLAAQLVLDVAGDRLTAPLWTGGPAASELLLDAGLVEETAAGVAVVLPPPAAGAALGRLLAALTRSASSSIDLGSTLQLSSFETDGHLGLRLFGHIDAALGDLAGSVLFGEPEALQSDGDRGINLQLFATGEDDLLSFAPALRSVGSGVGLRRADGTALVRVDGFRLGSVSASCFFDCDLADGLAVDGLGGAIELSDFGVPLGQATGTSGNPIAANLLRSASGIGGDAESPAPAVDVVLVARDGEVRLELGGQPGPLWIGVQRAFGPLYIDRLGLRPIDGPGAELALDGSVEVGGLSLQLDELGVDIPLASLLDPGDWRLDLAGLTVSFDGAGISLRGGLRKTPGPPLEYQGAVTVEVAGRSFGAAAAYAQPTDELGAYTSLFAFVSLPVVLGGPPFFFVTGLGGGFGYNRELTTPEDAAQVDEFPLVQAIDDARFSDDPMAALEAMSKVLAPRRGGMWAAAGARFTTFERLKTHAIVYASLEGDLEIGLLGISRMTLPTQSAALAHVELALQARYSHAEGLLSTQGVLTDGSWLLGRDCKLTGGFGFFMWFRRWQFVLTLGGYAPGFVAPPEFPRVPPLGFDWPVSDHVTIEGGCYLAITSSCVMAGGNLDAVYDKDGLRAWFDAEAHILVAWDPLQYDFAIAIDVGASWTKRVCFIKCVTLHLSGSVGASLHLQGPPLHGEVTVDLAITSLTVRFGSAPQHIPYIESWDVFARKYLGSGAPGGSAVSIHAAAGLRSGAEGAPWTLAGEFAITTESQMPASSYSDFVHDGDTEVLEATAVDLAPMGKTSSGPAGVRSHHQLQLARRDGAAWVDVRASEDGCEITERIGHVPEAIWRFSPPDEMAAGANTLPALVGLRLGAVATLTGGGAEIALAATAPPGSSLPLPLATAPKRPALVDAGRAAEAMLPALADAPAVDYTATVGEILGGSGVFAEARRQIGLEPTGLSSAAARSLARDRSAPPRIVPLSAGLTMRPGALEPPPAIATPPRAAPVSLDSPRLRAVVRLEAPVSSEAAPLHTSVAEIAAATVPRLAPPAAPEILGAALVRVSGSSAAPRTATPAASLSLAHADLGAAGGGPRRRREFDELADGLASDGVAVPAGTVHLWDLPASAEPRSLVVSPDVAARVVVLDRTGEVVRDLETLGESAAIPVPDQAARLAVAALGAIDATLPARGFGVVSASRAPTRGSAATGWQSGDELVRLGARALMARGATMMLARPMASRGDGRNEGAIAVRAADVVAAQPAIETRLPAGTDVVLVFLDLDDLTAARSGDIALAVSGATLAPEPRRISRGRRLALVYDVGGSRGDQDHVAVAFASRSGFKLGGVVGVRGSGAAWAARLEKTLPTRLVPELVLRGAGQLQVRMTTETR